MTQDRPPRYAIYFTPDPESPLARFGAGVIGYDSDGGHDVTRIPLDAVSPAEVVAATQAPRHYGFHATLVAPFEHNGLSEDELRTGLEDFGAQAAPALLGTLEVSMVGGFIALTAREACPEVNDLAARCVMFFDRYRAPLEADDVIRRSAGELSPRQYRNLERWGYPYVLEEFRFHMTLTGRLAPDTQQRFHYALAEAFRPLADVTHRIETVTLMRQDDPESEFVVVARAKLSQRL
jgi:putative phosphonate metabolism protein